MIVPPAPVSLDDVLNAQGNLNFLCRERPLRTPELFKPNDFYGNAAVLKRYAHVSPSRSLKGVLPHGVNLNPNWAWSEEVTAPLPAIFYYPDYYRSAYARQTTKPLFAIASPFLYALAQVGSTPGPKRMGTIFFPGHSTDHCTAEYDHTSLATHLTSLPPKMHPITVCMYYKDYLAGRSAAFRDSGFPIVTAGHMFDPLFLYRLAHLCRMHVFAASNIIGTHLFYAVTAGCTYVHIDHGVPSYRRLSNAPRPPPDTARDDLHSQIHGFFAGKTNHTNAAQRSFVDSFLSANQFLPPSGLRGLIEEVESLDWTAEVAAVRLLGYGRIPYGYARPFIRAGRYLRTLTRVSGN